MSREILMTVNLDDLMEPIREQAPAGEDLRYSPIFGQIQDARRADDAGLPVGVWDVGLKKSDWPRVVELCQHALIHETKDIRVVSWLAEAWLNLFGLSALGDGLKLYQALIDRYWDTLFPKADEDTEMRLAAIEKGLDLLLQSLLVVPFVRAREGFECTLAQWRQAEYETRIHARLEEEAQRSQPGMTLDTLQFYLRDILFDEMKKKNDSVSRAQQALQDLQAACQKRPLNEQPGFYRLRNVLQEIRGILKKIEPPQASALDSLDPAEKTIVSTDPGADLDGIEHQLRHRGPQTSPTQATLLTREEAYRRLGELADYLQNIEPHSPAPFLVRRAITWGGMNLPDLFDELFQEGQDVAQIRRLLGF